MKEFADTNQYLRLKARNILRFDNPIKDKADKLKQEVYEIFKEFDPEITPVDEIQER